ncbi:MAG: YggT family protein [Candidatus Sericytochromatia bacterium]|nr:YggT family protein [Candidatus Sericytochromatia bacterium]
MTSVLVDLLDVVYNVWSILLLVWVVMSWVPNVDRSHPLVNGISRVIEPALAPFRKLVPGMGPIDISPLIAMAAYQVIYQVLRRLLTTGF